MNKITYKLEPVVVKGFEKLIREIVQESKVPARQLSNQVTITYDRNKGKASVYKKMIWDKLLPSREKYMVDTLEKVIEKQSCKLEAVKHGDLEIEFSHKIKVTEGRETLFTTRMVGRNNPQVTISHKLNEAMDQVIDNHINEIYTDHDGFQLLVKKAMSKLGDELGLDIHTSVAFLTKIHIPQSQEIQLTKTRVQPKDFNEKVNLNYELSLLPDGTSQNELLASQSYKRSEEIMEMLETTLKSYIREKVSYNELIQQINSRIRKELIHHWNGELSRANKGWKIGDLTLELPDEVPLIYQKAQLEVPVTLKNAEISLKNTINLDLVNPEQFKASRIGNMEEWVHMKLQQATQSIVAGQTFAGLIHNLDQLSEDIYARFGQYAQDIGYKVDNFHISGLLDPTKTDVELRINEEDTLFETQIKDSVKLTLTIKGRIRDFNHAKWHLELRPESSPADMIKAGVINFLSGRISSLSSESFYNDFNSEEFKETIKEALKGYLVNDFNVDEKVEINLLIGHTALIERLRNLSKGQKSIIMSFFNGAAEFKVSYKIIGVDTNLYAAFAANIFSNIDEEVEAINDALKNCLHLHIDLPVDKLKDRKTVAQYIMEQAEDKGVKRIKYRFSLNIEIVQVDEVKNVFSNAGNDIVTRGIIDDMVRMNERIAVLKDKIYKWNLKVNSKEELEEWKKELKELEEKLLPIYHEPQADQTTILLNSPKETPDEP